MNWTIIFAMIFVSFVFCPGVVYWIHLNRLKHQKVLPHK